MAHSELGVEILFFQLDDVDVVALASRMRRLRRQDLGVFIDHIPWPLS